MRRISRQVLAVLALVMLAGCEMYTPASVDEIARARYVSDEPPSITLISDEVGMICVSLKPAASKRAR